MQAVSIDLAMAAGVEGAEVVHSHTWYTNFAGHLAKLLTASRMLRPCTAWSLCALGRPSSSVAATRCLPSASGPALEAADAIIAVSEGMRRDVLACYPAIEAGRVEVIYNGVDTEEYRPDEGTDVLERNGIDPELPSVVFVGRITRQKGLRYLLDAAPAFDPPAQLVLCAGAPDTPELGAEVERRVERLRAERGGVIWLDRMLPRKEVVQILSHATVFVCPSIYEPLGIVNLEAMACEAAVVATATGGIVEVVDDGVTGLLVPFEPTPRRVAGPARPRGLRRRDRWSRQRVAARP